YQIARPFIFLQSAQSAHEQTLKLLNILDKTPVSFLRLVHTLTFRHMPVTVGKVDLPHPFILAAGFVKGLGFETEQQALRAVRDGVNIIPGWRAIPGLVGAVEFGSFTRYPRVGNSGTVIWRDSASQSTQNRVGLKNPGAVAAAAFLYQNRKSCPKQFGINIAPSPGVDDPVDVVEAIGAFLSRGIRPSWFTLNLSCPNTEDDPENRQTETLTKALCGAAMDYLNEQVAGSIPLWVKISPNLSYSQLDVLMKVFHDLGIAAVIATNTLTQPIPDNATMQGGVGGGKLYPYALSTVAKLAKIKQEKNYPIDIIACGGIQDPLTYIAYAQHGVKAYQYWSALVYRGPLAAALILNEI
ncbi:MAG: hypothetical protein CUN56_05910, partial [Phototrophicales bacterium]